MPRADQGLNQAFTYRVLSPILYIPWVWTQFFAAAIVWFWLAMYAVWTRNSTIYYYPIWGMFIFFAVAPFQESQQEIIKIIEIVVEGINDLFDNSIFPAIEDMFYVVQPACWAHNFLWDGSVYIFKLAIYDPIKLALNIIFPYNPYAFLGDITLSAGAFPVTTAADTSSSPDWLVGPYGKRRSQTTTNTEDPIMHEKRKLNGDDPSIAALVRWSRQHHLKGHVKIRVNMEELDQWSDEEIPKYFKESISQRILRRTMDQNLGIETPGWWERNDNDDNGDNNKFADSASVWADVFDVGYQSSGWRGLSLVRMDNTVEGKDLRDNLKLQMAAKAGAIRYRVLADSKGTRDLNFAIFQAIAEIFNIFFDAVAQILVQLWNIMLVIGMNLFSDIENFFTNAADFVANIFNQIWQEFLNLPCLKFDSVQIFAISLLDCICQPLTEAVQNLGGNIALWFNYQRPDNIDEIPQAILSCVGLGCIDVNLLVTNPNQFATNLIGDCMGLPDIAVCCVVDLPNCIQSVIITLTNCPCGGGGSVSAPACDFGINDSTDWFKCIMIFFSNEVLVKLGGQAGTNCNINGCPSLTGVANGIIQCIAAGILDLDFFVDTLSNIFGIDIGCDLSNPLSCFRRRRRHRSVEAQLDSPLNDDDELYGALISVAAAEDNSYYINQLDMPYKVMFPEDNLRPPRRSSSNYAELLTTREKIDMNLAIYKKQADQQQQQNVTRSPEYTLMLQRLKENMELKRSFKNPNYEDMSFVQQLSNAIHPQSRGRHRALLQVQIDQHVYSNPAILVATNRFSEICRDLVDFLEFRMYGPDPFTMPPDDANPSQDPRTVSAPRYVDQSDSHGQAYMMHASAVAENPYYAGLYKLLFQVGDVKNISAGDNENDASWKAMASHANDPLFHVGRIMAASRQVIFAYTQIFKEVWWDSDVYNFHFPNYAQIGHILVQTRIPLYMDDMRSAIGGLLRSRSDKATIYLNKQTMDYIKKRDMETTLKTNIYSNPFTTKTTTYQQDHHGDGGDAETYNFISSFEPESEEKRDVKYKFIASYDVFIQAEIAVRTVVTRLLVPDKVEAMLDELSTRSAVHAVYANRMKRKLARQNIINPPTKSLSYQIASWRRNHYNSNAKNQETNRIIIDLDRIAHPQAGNITLLHNQRITFADGQKGIFLGTVGSMVSLNPTRSLGGGGTTNEVQRVAIMAVFAALKDVVMFLVNNWQLIATALSTILMSPWGRVIWESYLLFLYNRIIAPLFTRGLAKLFGNINDILDLTIDFLALTDTIIFFLLNEIARLIGCYVWALMLAAFLLPIVMILNILSTGLLQPLIMPLMLVLIGVVFLVPYCPPEQVIIDNKMTQVGPWKYYDDIIKCFADDISIGKNAYNGICSVSSDCPGAAPCICENKGGQYGSVFITFEDNTICGTQQAPTGQCLCWPKLDCQFLFFRLNNENLFADTCADLGYKLEIAWYQPVGYLQIFSNCYYNFWVSVKYITRTLTRDPQLPSLLTMIFISIGMLVLFYLNTLAGLIVISLVFGYIYALPLWKKLIIDIIIPSLDSALSGIPLVSYLSNYALSFVRFPNHSVAQPLGFNRPGEGTCFLFNLGTFFGGAAINFWYWSLILTIVWYGAGSILWFIFNNLMVPIRVISAPIWLYRQRSRVDRHFQSAKNYMTSSMPYWVRKHGSRAGSSLWSSIHRIGTKIKPQAPDTKLNQWISHYYPDPLETMNRFINPNGTNPYMRTPGNPIHINARNHQEDQQQQQQLRSSNHNNNNLNEDSDLIDGITNIDISNNNNIMNNNNNNSTKIRQRKRDMNYNT